MARIAFMGTPDSSVPALRALAKSHEVALVVTQPDRPRGRSAVPQAPPVKEAAIGLGLDVSQPSTRSELRESVDSAGELDVGVVVAYGRILEPSVLEVPRKGWLNIHFSLLPRWRGAAPVARAIMAGDTMTGVTVMRIDEGLDTGPVLTAQAIDIRRGESAGELTGRLADVGAALLASAIPGYLSGEAEVVEQSDDGVTYADKITPADRALQVSESVEAVVNQVRGLAPAPGATLEIDGVAHKILGGEASPEAPEPGTWAVYQGRPVIGLADGGMEITSLQPPSKQPMSGSAWALGRRRDTGLVR